jgi:hypothetical protein
VVADATNAHRMFGLGNTNQNAGYADVEYGLHLMDNGALEVLESGNNRGTYGSYSVGDVLKVAVVSGVVKYYRNNTVIYTSSVTPSYSLYLDTSFYSPRSFLLRAFRATGLGGRSPGVNLGLLSYAPSGLGAAMRVLVPEGLG